MLHHYTSLEDVYFQNTWLTIGSFDGVHLGHQKLIHELNNGAHQIGEKSIVLTFYPHPAVVLRNRTDAFYLTTPTERVNLIEQLGTDIVVTHPFTREVSQSTAREFVDYLLAHLGFLQLWVGHDFALGKGREGDVDYLQQLGKELKFTVHVVEPVSLEGSIISSSGIRRLLLEGMVEDANKMLGRPYRVEGEVVHGDGRGKKIGIPTANLDTGKEKLIPGAGVYACKVLVSGKEYAAAVNVGTRPTFESVDLQSHVEAHILDYSGNLYSQTISIDFISRLRGEQRFQNVDDLIHQIYLDIDITRKIVASR